MHHHDQLQGHSHSKAAACSKEGSDWKNEQGLLKEKLLAHHHNHVSEDELDAAGSAWTHSLGK